MEQSDIAIIRRLLLTERVMSMEYLTAYNDLAGKNHAQKLASLLEGEMRNVKTLADILSQQ